MKIFVFLLSALLFFSTCKKNKCQESFYGIPLKITGLDDSVCKPSCRCKRLKSKLFTEIELAEMDNYQLLNPFEEIVSNPYDESLKVEQQGVCAVIIESKLNKTYRLETFKNEEEAKKAEGVVIHIDACGTCSTLQDLKVYAEKLDIGADFRLCAFQNLNNPFDSLISCIEGIGLTKPCSQIWAYNTKNTSQVCLEECLRTTIYNNPDGSLSECLLCDETKSGPVFKAVAGRTRRNTGIANAICRKCTEVQIVKHNYPF